MPITPAVEPGEKLIGNFELMLFSEETVLRQQPSPFALAVTNRALLLPHEQVFGNSREWYVERLPLSEVRQLRVQPLMPFGWYVVALLMIAVAVLAALDSHGEQIARNISSIALLLIAGFALLYAARGRYALIIERTDGTSFTWKPPLVKGSGRWRRDHFVAAVIDAARRAGIIVVDNRNPKLVVGVSIPQASP